MGQYSEARQRYLDQLDLEDEYANSTTNSSSLELRAATRDMVGDISRLAGVVTGSEAANDYADTQQQRAAILRGKSTYVQNYEDIEGPGDAISYLTKVAIGSIPTIASLAAGGAGGVRLAGQTVGKGVAWGTGAVAANYPARVGSHLNTQLDEAGTTNLPAAAALGVPDSALDLLGFEGRLLRGVNVASGATRLRQAGRSAVEGAAAEGAAEGAQAVLSEVSRLSVNEDHDILGEEGLKRIKEGTITGLALGGSISGAQGAIKSPRSTTDARRDGPEELSDTSDNVTIMPALAEEARARKDEMRAKTESETQAREDLRRTQLSKGIVPAEIETPTGFEALAAGQKPAALTAKVKTRKPEDMNLATREDAPFRGDTIDTLTLEDKTLPSKLVKDIIKVDAKTATGLSKILSDTFDVRNGDKTTTRARAFLDAARAKAAKRYEDATVEGGPKSFPPGSPQANAALEKLYASEAVFDRTQRILDAWDARLEEMTAPDFNAVSNPEPGSPPIPQAPNVFGVPKPPADIRLGEPGTGTEQDIRDRNLSEGVTEEQFISEELDRIAADEDARRSDAVATRRARELKEIAEDPKTYNVIRRAGAHVAKGKLGSPELTDAEVEMLESAKQTASRSQTGQQVNLGVKERALSKGPAGTPTSAAQPEQLSLPKPPTPGYTKSRYISRMKGNAAKLEPLPEVEDTSSTKQGELFVRSGPSEGRATPTADNETENAKATYWKRARAAGIDVHYERSTPRSASIAEITKINADALRAASKDSEADALVTSVLSALNSATEKSYQKASALNDAASARITELTRLSAPGAVPKQGQRAKKRSNAAARKAEEEIARRNVAEGKAVDEKAVMAAKMAARKAETDALTPVAEELSIPKAETVADPGDALSAKERKAAGLPSADSINTRIDKLNLDGHISDAAMIELHKLTAVSTVANLTAANNTVSNIEKRVDANKAKAKTPPKPEDDGSGTGFKSQSYARPRNTQGEDINAVKDKVYNVLKDWTNVPPTQVFEFMKPTNDAQRHIVRQILLRDGPNHSLEGAYFFYKGAPHIAVFADRYTTDAALNATIYHEMLGHYGMRDTYGRGLNKVLADIYDSTPAIRNQVDALMNSEAYRNQARETGKLGVDPRLTLIEETLVFMGEKQIIPNGVLDRIAAFVRSFARKVGWKKGAYSDAELLDILRKGQQRVIKGQGIGLTGRRARSGLTAIGQADAPLNARARSYNDGYMKIGGDGFLGRDPAGAAAAPPRRPQNTDDKIKAYVEKYVPASAQSYALSAATTLRDWAKKGVYGMSFSRDFVDQTRAILSSTGAYFEVAAEKSAEAYRLKEQIHNIMQDAYKLDEKTRTALKAFLRNSTLNETWGYQPTWLTTNIGGVYTPAQVKKITVKIDPAARKEYEALGRLSEEAQTVADKVFRQSFEVRQEMRAAVQAQIQGELTGPEFNALDAATKKQMEQQAARKLKLFDATLKELRGPYAPLSRFGDFVAVAKSNEYLAIEKIPKDRRTEEQTNALNAMRTESKHYIVQMTESLGKARLLADEMRAENANMSTEYFQKENLANTMEAPWVGMQRLRTLVRDELGGEFGTEAAKKIDTLMMDLYISALAESSARRHNLKRERIAGADEDMLRSFATKGEADANFVASISGNDKITKALTMARDEASQDGDINGYNKADRRRVLREVLSRHVSGITDAPNSLIDKASAFTSGWLLMTAPTYYIQNATQAYMVGLPVISAYHGYKKSVDAMSTAYSDIMASTEGVKDFFSGEMDVTNMKGATGKPLPADEIAVLEKLRVQGLVDIGMQYELGFWESQSGGGLSKNLQLAVHKVRSIARSVEMANRISTGLAAYRLMKVSGKSNEVAYSHAASMISQTQGDYSWINTPSMFKRIPAGKLITQFRKYQIIQASLLIRYGNQAFAGTTPEERAVGRAALRNILGQTAVVTGALGIPGVQLAAYTLAAIFGDEDDPVNGEKFLRDSIGDETTANFLLGGVPAGALDINLTGNLGTQNAFALSPYNDGDLTSRDGFAKAVVGVLGPTMGVASSFADGAGQIAQGDYYKGIETMLPRGLRNAMKSYRETVAEGVTKRNGDLIMSSEEFNALQTLVQGLGFSTQTMKNLRDKRSDIYEAEEFFKARTTKIRKDYTEAAKLSNAGAMSQARTEWSGLQEAKARYGIKASTISELLSAPRQQEKRAAKYREQVGVDEVEE